MPLLTADLCGSVWRGCRCAAVVLLHNCQRSKCRPCGELSASLLGILQNGRGNTWDLGHEGAAAADTASAEHLILHCCT